MHRPCVMIAHLCVTVPGISGSLQSVGSPEHAMHRPSNRLALKRKSTRRVVRTTGFPFKRVFPWSLLINSFVRYSGYTSVETANKTWNLIRGSDKKRRKTYQEDGNGKGSGDPKDQENENIQLLPTYTKNPTTRRKKNYAKLRTHC